MAGAGLGRILVALIVGQICLHACMTGVRMAAPLQALREGHAAWVVGPANITLCSRCRPSTSPGRRSASA